MRKLGSIQYEQILGWDLFNTYFFWITKIWLDRQTCSMLPKPFTDVYLKKNDQIHEHTIYYSQSISKDSLKAGCSSLWNRGGAGGSFSICNTTGISYGPLKTAAILNMQSCTVVYQKTEIKLIPYATWHKSLH